MLDKIIDKKREYIKNKFTKEYTNEVIYQDAGTKGRLIRALIKDKKPALIGEIKKASPSKGIIRENFDVSKLAEQYDEAQVDAISVLTETDYFLGDPDHIRAVLKKTSKPVLRKDFIIDIRQIFESVCLGADAILLIVSILSFDDLKLFKNTADNMGLDVLFEVRDEAELDRALLSDAKIIGINNRDLKTFNINLKTSLKLLPKIPKGIITVSESGINSHEDLLMMKEAGADALLVGECLMRSGSIRKSVLELIYGCES